MTVSYLIHYDTSLPDVITKCDSYFITKYDRSLLQNASVFLLQNATVNYYKIRQLLKIATILLENATFITNCDSTVVVFQKHFH